MTRNVEIKAKVRDRDEIVRLAKELTGDEPTVLRQHDIFYNSPEEIGTTEVGPLAALALCLHAEGGLKLAGNSDDERAMMRTELIWYDRPDVAGPKECKYNKFDVPQEILEPLKTSLQCSMGIKGEVNKTRTLFIHERTRIHIDSVEGLGDFMELEVKLFGHPLNNKVVTNHLVTCVLVLLQV
ncbi:unnamed protein product [Heligmosomoides polygyrus]|uniref:CYTH domain-containing protein n=1 Tax=Heligmosomoides polygyrus TaxID=6339 RepID=A0A183GA12_HELPZ|nr:unnamed protein product [Heligmosomoides polygyrus]